jgi:ubiquinone/menaquinone biosynthesis C-methylase UbiE
MSVEMEMAKGESSEEKRHQHRGKFSEGLLDNELILNALNIQQGQTVLDAGCGNGYMTKAFSSRVALSGKVYALDHDEHFIGILRQETQGTNVEAMECDITRSIPIDQGSVDLIYISTVIHGFSKPQLRGFLGEAQRLLKPNGLLAIVEIEKKETSFGPPLNIRFSPEELKEVVPMAPLSTIQVGKNFYMQLFRNSKCT